MKYLLAAAGIFVLVFSSAFAAAGIQDPENDEQKKRFLYEWKDASGMIHITDALGKVPVEYRAHMRTLEVPGREEPDRRDRQEQRWSSQEDLAARNEAEAKAEWQSRLRSWKQRRESAEQQLQDLEREREELFRAWGSASMAPIENRLKAEKIEKQMQDVRNEIERARNMLEEVIPEEARKAGVPPGWLRE